MTDWMPLIVSCGVATVVAIAGALLTEIGPWYRELRKPWFQPPDWLFGPAWTVIFALTAWSASHAWQASAAPGWRAMVVTLFLANAAANMGWSLLFFRLRRPDWALIEVSLLWLSIVAPMVLLGPTAPLSALLLVPYLLWVSFASYLNLTIVRLNAPFGAAASEIASR